MTISVRPATLDDIPWLLGQLKEFDAFFGSSRSLFPSLEQAEHTLAGMITDHPFLVADNDVGPVGFIAGALINHPYNPSLLWLSETFWWVAEAYRGSRAGLALLNAFISLGEERAVQWITMTLESDSKIDPEHLYRRGFRLKEVSYLLEIG